MVGDDHLKDVEASSKPVTRSTDAPSISVAPRKSILLIIWRSCCGGAEELDVGPYGKFAGIARKIKAEVHTPTGTLDELEAFEFDSIMKDECLLQ